MPTAYLKLCGTIGISDVPSLRLPCYAKPKLLPLALLTNWIKVDVTIFGGSHWDAIWDFKNVTNQFSGRGDINLGFGI